MSDPSLTVVLAGHKKAVKDISFHPDNSKEQFVTCSDDNTLMVWNTIKHSRSYSYAGHKSEVTAVEYSSSGRIIASSSTDCSVRYWASSIKGDCTEFKAHVSPVHCLNFSNDGTKLITGARDKSVKMWDANTKRFIQSFCDHNNWVISAKFLPDSQMIVSASADRTVKVWDVISGQCIHTFVGSQGCPTYVAPHLNNNSIAVATDSGSVRIYEIRNKNLQQHYHLHDHATYVSWHPSQNYMLTCGKDGKIRIVDVIEGRPLYTMGGHESAVNCVKFNSNGEYFASGGDDKYVMVWKTNFTD